MSAATGSGAAAGRTWAVVLAAGEGSRLSQLTRDEDGRPVPKQFCSLDDGPSLLLEAMRRGQRVAGRERLTAIVAAQHEPFWRGALWPLRPDNVIVQPQNRGTAIGVLLATLAVAANDPLARIVFLPADHHVRDEDALAAPLEAAIDVAGGRQGITLLGIEPDEPDPELGYVVPLERAGAAQAVGVGRFEEKPDRERAAGMIAGGALWNSFIFAAAAATVIALIRARYPLVVDEMETALARGPRALAELYLKLPALDFSRDVLQGAEGQLAVVRVPACGWTDLGTPHRVGACLRRLSTASRPARRRSGSVSLASAYQRFEQALQGAMP
jgi:mannose-1-phosphate guanylyltransferase